MELERVMELKCQNCGAPRQYSEYLDVFRCDHCGTAHLPSAEILDGIVSLEGQSRTECPLGHGPLNHATADRWSVLQCRRCAGVFAADLTFWRIVQYRRLEKGDPFRPPTAVTSAELSRRIRCTGCGKEMAAHPYYGPGRFVIDHCASCSAVWLDRGEIARAVHTEHKP